MQTLSRRSAMLLLFLFALALLRAERGVSEIQGRPAGPSRLLHLSTQGAGIWDLAFLGLEHRLDTRIVLIDSEQPLPELQKALPAWW